MDFQTILTYILAIVGAASLLVQVFAKIAKITPNTKDDVIAGKLTRWVGVVVAVLDKLALNLTDKDARKCEDGKCEVD